MRPGLCGQAGKQGQEMAFGVRGLRVLAGRETTCCAGCCILGPALAKWTWSSSLHADPLACASARVGLK